MKRLSPVWMRQVTALPWRGGQPAVLPAHTVERERKKSDHTERRHQGRALPGQPRRKAKQFRHVRSVPFAGHYFAIGLRLG
jgi:hypothetical protein